jgi:Zn-dependent protease/tetratricopeptide (TPR) repeat protein
MRILGIPLSVDVSFFLIVGFLGMGRGAGAADIALWIGVVFVSVLVHELGHALVGRAYGLTPRIHLYGMGGLTSWSETTEVRPARRLAISLAGPFAGFLLGAVIYAVYVVAFSASGPAAYLVLTMCLWVNVGWGVLNLLPMLPLDGGNVLRSAIEIVTGRSGDLPAQVVSVVVAGAVGVAALAYGEWWGAGLAVWFGYTNVTALVESWRESEDDDVLAALAAAWRDVEEGRGPSAVAAIEDVQRRAHARTTKRRAAEALVYAHLQAHAADEARKAYGVYTALYGKHPYLEGAVALETGDPERALAVLEPLFDALPVARVGRELCRAYVRTGRVEKALAVCSSPVAAPFAAQLYTAVSEEAYRAKRFDVSADAGATAAELSRDPMVAYNVACALARAGRDDEAASWLARAVDYGFADASLAASDDDLITLHGRSEFRAAIHEIQTSLKGTTRRDPADSQVP